MTLSRVFFLAGAMPYLVLGAAHALATPLTPESRKGLAPRDPALVSAMRNAVVLLTSRTDVWRAWIGFNLSHSLGAVVFGAFVLLIGRSDAAFAADSAFALPLVTLVAAVYLIIGIRYWFRTPITGIAISLACFALSWALLLFGPR